MLMLPSIDVLRFADLVTTARTGIARRAPSWTNHNVADPGITLVDLAAWLAETTMFELDQIPDAVRAAFLELAGHAPRGPGIAEAILSLAVDPPAYRSLPAGLQISDVGGLVFETVEPAWLTAGRLVEASAGGRILPAPEGVDPFDPLPGHDAVLSLGFDALPAPPGEPFRLALWTATPGADIAKRRRMEEAREAAGCAAWCADPSAAVFDPAHHYGVRLTWEFFAADGSWQPLVVVRDDTLALTLSGAVELLGPPDAGLGSASIDARGLYRFRCRIAHGRHDERVRLARIALGVVTVRHRAMLDEWQTLAPHEGHAEERRPLKPSPALPGTVELRVTPPGGTAQPWAVVDRLDRQTPHAQAAMLAPDGRSLVFGDGRFASVPATGSAIRVLYAYGGGTAGNLKAGSLDRFVQTARHQALVPDWLVLSPMLTLDQPVDAAGGIEPETIPEARLRLARALAMPARMATLDDITGHALTQPGLPVARAFALPDIHPDFEGYTALGCVTLVIVPSVEPAYRTPTLALCRALRLALEPARTLTLELYVVPPVYVPVTIEADVDVQPDAPGVASAIEAAIAAFLEPFSGAGGEGWRPGATLHAAEIAAVIAAVPGVACVTALALSRETACGTVRRDCARLTLCPTELPVPGTPILRLSGGVACRRVPDCPSERGCP